MCNISVSLVFIGLLLTQTSEVVARGQMSAALLGEIHPRVVLAPVVSSGVDCCMDTDLAVPMPKRELYFVFGALMLGMLLAALDSTIVATAFRPSSATCTGPVT